MQNNTAGKELTAKVIRSVKWSALMTIVTKIASPLILIVLSQLLTSEDFGIVATATIAISFFKMFNDAGLNQALIHTQKNISESANIVFWVSIGLGGFIYLGLFFAAPFIGIFFNSPATGPVIRVLSLQVLIGSFATVQRGLFIKDFQFKKLFWVKLLTAFVPGVISIPFALYGYGVWALVYGSLAGQLLDVILLWRFSSWRPSFKFDKAIARALFGFGAWTMGETFLIWFFSWGDSLILGKYLGVKELGVYRLGIMIISLVYGIFLNPITPLVYPLFSKVQKNVFEYKKMYLNIFKLIASVSLPIGVLMFSLSYDIKIMFFANDWEGLGYVVSTLGLAYGFSWLVGVNLEVYRGLGKPKYNVQILLISVFVFLPAYVFASRYGLEVFSNTRFGLIIFGIIIHLIYMNKIIHIKVMDVYHALKVVLTLSLLLAIMLFFLKVLYHSLIDLGDVLSILLLFAGTLFSLGLYFFLLVRIDRSTYIWIKTSLN